jgi:hypothetical protein
MWNMGWLLMFALRSPELSPIQTAFRIPYEDTIAAHRWMGWSTMVWVFLHATGYITRYMVEGSQSNPSKPGHAAKLLTPNFRFGFVNFFGLLSVRFIS